MCGIAGWFCWGEQRPDIGTIKGLLHAAQSRGTDAAGIAYQRDNGLIGVLKQPGRAEDLIKAVTQDRWDEIAASPRGMLHARAKTKGDAKNNANNHPVYGFDWVVVHNGHVTNDDDVYQYYKAERFAEVDSSAIPLVLSQGKDDYLTSLGHVATLGGNITASMWSSKWIDRIALVRLGSNDLYLVHDRDRDILYWTSTLLATQSIPSLSLGKQKFYTVSQLNDDRVLVLYPDGRDATKLMEIKRNLFYMPKGYSVGNPSKAPSPTKSTQHTDGKGAGASTHSDRKNFTFKWYRPALAKEYVGKPQPTEEHHSNFDLFWHVNIMGRFNSNPKLTEFSLPTGYGTWYFWKIPGMDKPTVSRGFKPHKRVKNWFRNNFKSDDVVQLLDLPIEMVSTETISSAFDGLLPLERYVIMEWENATVHTQRHGFMCPWCGVVGLRTTWEGTQYRCWLCRIKSALVED